MSHSFFYDVVMWKIHNKLLIYLLWIMEIRYSIIVCTIELMGGLKKGALLQGKLQYQITERSMWSGRERQIASAGIIE